MPVAEPKTVVLFEKVGYRTMDGTVVLVGLDLSVDHSEVLILLGRSGSGKTTALKLINRLLSPSSGQVMVEGRSTAEWDPIALRRRIGYAIQEVGLFPHLTVRANIGLVPRLLHWHQDAISSRVADLMERLDLPLQLAQRYPHELSGGQRQRVGLARALAADPPLLLMDEPFAALDPLTRAEIQRGFKSLQQQLTKTVVFVTHDVREALRIGTRIALLSNGAVIGSYTPDDFRRSQQPEVAAYTAVLNDDND